MHQLLCQIRRVNRSRNCLELSHCFEIFFQLAAHGLYRAHHAPTPHLELLLVDYGLHLLTVVVFEAFQVLVEEILHRLVDLFSTLC